MDAVILVGGLGTRLRNIINDRPKPMAIIVNKPFLEYVLDLLIDAGIKNVILAIGYKGLMIKKYFGSGENWGLNIKYSYEDELLGTAGAIKNASELIKSEQFLVLNGDTYFDVNFMQLFDNMRNYAMDMNIVLRKVTDVSRYGEITIKDNKIVAFNEKSNIQKSGVINGGIYLMKSNLISSIPEGNVSLEDSMFPLWFNEGKQIGGIVSDGYFIDIGIPEDYYTFCKDITIRNESYKKDIRKEIDILLSKEEISISSTWFLRWKKEIKIMLRKVYGVQSDQYNQFQQLRFEPNTMNVTMDYRKEVTIFCKRELEEFRSIVK